MPRRGKRSTCSSGCGGSGRLVETGFACTVSAIRLRVYVVVHGTLYNIQFEHTGLVISQLIFFMRHVSPDRGSHPLVISARQNTIESSDHSHAC
jgi:hypothetical protein